MPFSAKTFLAAALFSLATAAHASEAEFLEQFEGTWSGSGAVKVKANSDPVSVSCSLRSRAEGEALSMNGTCRAMILASRRIAADIRAAGGSYSGSYSGGGKAMAALAGRRSGNTLNLAIRWSRNINGDRQAQMEVASLGDGRMRLRTIDTHPTSGKRIVTSDIELTRN